MKKNFLAMMAAFVSVCLFLTLAPPQLKSAALSCMDGDCQAPPHVCYFIFYIEKRQWLADARTIMAGIRYLFDSHETDTIMPTNIVPDYFNPPVTNDGLKQVSVVTMNTNVTGRFKASQPRSNRNRPL
jgi:hypothetical protein